MRKPPQPEPDEKYPLLARKAERLQQLTDLLIRQPVDLRRLIIPLGALQYLGKTIADRPLFLRLFEPSAKVLKCTICATNSGNCCPEYERKRLIYVQPGRVSAQSSEISKFLGMILGGAEQAGCPSVQQFAVEPARRRANLDNADVDP